MESKKNFEYSPELYDLQVNWALRISKERELFEKIIATKNIRKILDIGCGTGHHVQLFSEIIDEIVAKKDLKDPGVINTKPLIVGMDPDEKMIKFAKENVVKSKVVKLIVGGFENLKNIKYDQFDFITCLGNTLALLGNRQKVKMALKATRKKLIKGGIALFQFLNFEPKMIKKERFYTPKTFIKDEFRYITMKHFEYGKVKTVADFIKIKIDSLGNIAGFENHTSYMCTLRKNMFLKMAKNSGFKKIELLSPGGNEEFDKRKHISLIAILYN